MIELSIVHSTEIHLQSYLCILIKNIPTFVFVSFYREDDHARKEKEHQQELEEQDKKSQKEINKLENRVSVLI